MVGDYSMALTSRTWLDHSFLASVGLFDGAGIQDTKSDDNLIIRLLQGVAPHEFGADKKVVEVLECKPIR